MDDGLRNLVHTFFSEKGKRISDDGDDLFELEIIDSLELMELLIFIEQKVQMSVPQEMMTADNFRSVEAIVRTLSLSSRPLQAPA